MAFAAPLIWALLLDASFGEPRVVWERLPHPAVLMGRLVAFLDRKLNHQTAGKLAGLAAVSVLIAVVLAIAGLVSALPYAQIWTVILASILLAQRSLVQHVRAVAEGLDISLSEGRSKVGQIVGRDTRDMTQADVARAAIESAAENLSDGVVAPVFWFLLAGLPGILVYKVINTADSMIGYRTPKYANFGWAAARLDDVLNWIPARLTGLLIAGIHGQLRNWPAISAEAKLQRSPNAGWPEAAMARVLNVALSGPRSYHGQRRDFPYVHESGKKQIGAAEIHQAATVLWRIWACLLVTTILLALL
ncbi:MAG: adenosylcobinamide-phosphate synthase CbiB [Mangrovicoccus sp.]